MKPALYDGVHMAGSSSVSGVDRLRVSRFPQQLWRRDMRAWWQHTHSRFNKLGQAGRPDGLAGLGNHVA